jgi:hypothetical protein
MDLRLVNSPPEGDDGNTERESNGGPKERANVNVAVPDPLRNGRGCKACYDYTAADAQNVSPGKTLFQPAAHELCASLRELVTSKIPGIACIESLVKARLTASSRSACLVT